LFREVNERIEDLSGAASFVTFVCECTDTRCDERVSVTLEEYEHVRADGDHFFVLPGHEASDVEEVVETSDRFLVVSKLGTGREVAQELDPRQNRELREASGLNGDG
jgi:hypothetical protein